MAYLCYAHKGATLEIFYGRIGWKNYIYTVYSGPVWKIVDMVTNFRVRDSLQKLNVKKRTD